MFAQDDQGFWIAATEAKGTNPGVTSSFELSFDPSLQDFLVRLCVRETIFTNAWVNNPPENAAELVDGLEPLIDVRHFYADSKFLVYMPNPDLLLMHSPAGGGAWFCARRPTANSWPGPPGVVAIGFDLGENVKTSDSKPPWNLKVTSDGDIELTRRTAHGLVQSRTGANRVNFGALSDALDEAETSEPAIEGEPRVIRYFTPTAGVHGTNLETASLIELLESLAPLPLDANEDLRQAWEMNPPKISQSLSLE